jgi:hypothetical protein
MEEMMQRIVTAAESIAENVRKQTEAHAKFLEVASEGWRKATETAEQQLATSKTVQVDHEMSIERHRLAIERTNRDWGAVEKIASTLSGEGQESK